MQLHASGNSRECRNNGPITEIRGLRPRFEGEGGANLITRQRRLHIVIDTIKVEGVGGIRHQSQEQNKWVCKSICHFDTFPSLEEARKEKWGMPKIPGFSTVKTDKKSKFS
jgi:hypothetical protein